MSTRARARADSFLLVGYLGTGNLGNDVSLAVVVDAIRRLQPTARLQVLSFGQLHGHPLGLRTTILDMERRTALSALSSRADRAFVKVSDALAAIPLLRRAGHVIVPGAGVLEENLGGGAWGLPWALAATVVAARAVRADVHLVAVGADEPSDPLTRLFFRLAARLATTRSFRDERSRESVRQLGVDTHRDPVVPDLAFARPQGRHVLASSSGRRRIALGVQAWHGHQDDSRADDLAHDAYVDAIGRLGARLLEQGDDVILLVGDAVDATVFEPILRVVAEHGHPRGSVETHTSTTFDDLVRVMAGCDVVIGSRFHNLIGAVVAGRPLISLGYADKHRDLMEELGLGPWAHDIDDVDVSAVVDEVRQAHQSQEQLGRRLRGARDARALEVAAHLDSVFGSHAAPSPPQGSLAGATS